MSRLSLESRWVMVLLVSAVAVTMIWLWRVVAHDPEFAFLARDGSARWITYPLPPDPRARQAVELAARFRRSFTLAVVPGEAMLNVRALNRYELSINDRPVNISERNPANWKKAQQRNIADYLRAGDNSIVVTVYHDRGPPALWMSVSTDEDEVNTDDSWDVSLAGAVWQRARLASEPMDPTRTMPDVSFPTTGNSIAKQWHRLVLFAVLSGIILIAVSQLSRWLKTRPSINGHRIDGALVVSLALAISLLWAILFWNNRQLLSATDGFDAPGHLAYVQYILDQKRLPWPDEGWSMFHPPLFYCLSAFVLHSAGLSTDDVAAHDALLVQALVFGVVFLVTIGLSLRLLFPDQLRRQVIGLMLAGFLPMHLYLFQFVTNETLASALVAVSIYVTLLVLVRDRPRFLISAALGLCLGAAMLTKFSALVLVVAVIGTLLGRVITRRGAVRRWLATSSIVILSCLAVCGWRYVAVWQKFGNPLVGNWDPRIVSWWQDPGYQTAGYYLRFGKSLVAPIFSAYYSFADGINSTLWGDGLISGYAELIDAPPWNLDLIAAGYWLALLPTIAIVVGVIGTLVRYIRKPSATWFLLGGLLALVSFAVVYMSLKVPSYAHAKAFYGITAVLPLCAMGAWGFDLLAGRWPMVRWILLIALGTWAMNAYVSLWIGRDSPAAQARIGRLYAALDGHDDLAKQHLSAALETDPGSPIAQLGMSELLIRRGQIDEAISQLRQFLTRHERNAQGHLKLATLLASQNLLDEALAQARRACELTPDRGSAWFVRGSIQLQRDQLNAAVHAFREALRITPDDAEAHHRLGVALAQLDQFEEMKDQFRLAIALKPDWSVVLNDFSWILSTHVDAAVRDGSEAVRHAAQAAQLTQQRHAGVLDTLAAAYAEAGDFERAMATAEKAFAQALIDRDETLADQIRARQQRYRQGKPYRETR